MFVSTLAFAFGSEYALLLSARGFQGIGTACVTVAGLAVLAQCHPDFNERTKVMGVALGGVGLGTVIGPIFGGFMYDFVGKSSPFLVLAVLCSICVLLQLGVAYPEVNHKSKDSTSLVKLVRDPFILMVTVALILSNLVWGMLDSSIPIIMQERMEVGSWRIGATFVSCNLCYMISTWVFGRMANHIGRWLTCLLGIYILGGASTILIFAYNPEFLIGPMALTGIGVGMVTSSMYPELGNLADLRHKVQYGSVYAIGDFAAMTGLAAGSAVVGALSGLIGYTWTFVGVSLICMFYGTLLFIIKKPKMVDNLEER